MFKTSLVLTGLLLFFVQAGSGKSCTDLLDTCKTLLESIPNSISTKVSSFNRSDCQAVAHWDTECNILYQNFWACVASQMSSCSYDVKIHSQLQRFREDYNSRCLQEKFRYKIGNCFCMTDRLHSMKESDAVQNMTESWNVPHHTELIW